MTSSHVASSGKSSASRLTSCFTPPMTIPRPHDTPRQLPRSAKACPVGLQIIGNFFDEGRVLQVASAYEGASGGGNVVAGQGGGATSRHDPPPALRQRLRAIVQPETPRAETKRRAPIAPASMEFPGCPRV